MTLSPLEGRARGARRTRRFAARAGALASGLLALVLAWPTVSRAQATPAADDLDERMRAAFVYGYPYYELMWLRHQALANDKSLTYTGQVNRLRHQRHLATPKDRWANGPINDTFYSTAWLDLGASPVLLSLPDTADRYYVLVLISADGNSFEYFGRRNTGTRARKVAIVGPRLERPAAGRRPGGTSADARCLRQHARTCARPGRHHPRPCGAGQVCLHAAGAGRAQRGTSAGADRRRCRAHDRHHQRVDRTQPAARGRSTAARTFSRRGHLRRRLPLGTTCRRRCRRAGARWRPNWWRNSRPRSTSIVATCRGSMAGLRFACRAASAATTACAPDRRPTRVASSASRRRRQATSSALPTARMRRSGRGRRYRLQLPAGSLPADAFWSVTLYELHPEGHYLLPQPDRALFDHRPHAGAAPQCRR
jgi:hypothetical protein